jgi:hypothetical protein
MTIFLQHEPRELAHQTPVAAISDRQVWTWLVTPVVKALLGPITSQRISLRDTAALIVPEDKLFNQNGHLLRDEAVRFPFYHSLYTTKRGCLIIRRDGIKLEVLGWYGNLERKEGQLIWKVALRDRRYDGTPVADDCALEHFSYADPKQNGNFFPDAAAVELYLFSYSPGSTISDACGDLALQSFVAQPFAYAKAPEQFIEFFDRAWASRRAPGQWACPIQDASEQMIENFAFLGQKVGYDILEVAASHYHVLRWCEVKGFAITDPIVAEKIAAFKAGLDTMKQGGTILTRSQESWVAVFQTLTEDAVPERLAHLWMPDIVWPQDNIEPANLWLWKPISEKARGMSPRLP